MYYAWAEKNTKPEVPSNQKQQQHELNGLLSVDTVSEQLYFQLHPKAKAEDIAAYFAHFCHDSLQENCTKIDIVLDNNSTHTQKMKGLLYDYLLSREICDTLEVNLLHSPAYSPDFNLAEYEIHLLRLQKLHHLPSTVTMEQIRLSLEDVKYLMSNT